MKSKRLLYWLDAKWYQDPKFPELTDILHKVSLASSLRSPVICSLLLYLHKNMLCKNILFYETLYCNMLHNDIPAANNHRGIV